MPGFLLGFAARYDEAARILGNHANIDIYVPNKWYQGYFFPCCVAYAVGLLLANVAVVLMETGQPALLYLVPCILGTFCIMARKEFKQMWVEGPAIRMADRLIIKCERHWNRQKMKKQVEKRDRERKLQTYQEGATSSSADTTRELQKSANTIINTEVPSGEDQGQEANGGLGSRRAAAASAPAGHGPRRPPSGGRNPGRGPPQAAKVFARPAVVNAFAPPPATNSNNAKTTNKFPTNLLCTPVSRRVSDLSMSSFRGCNSNRGTNQGRGRGQNSGRGKNPGRGPNPGRVQRRGPRNIEHPGHERSTTDPAATKQTKTVNEEEPSPEETRLSLANIGDTLYQTDNDICLANEHHAGTKAFRRAVQMAVTEHANEEFGPEIFKSITKQFKGRRFVRKASSSVLGTWVELSKSEMIDEAAKAFHAEKMRVHE